MKITELLELKLKIEIQKSMINQQQDEILYLKNKQLFKEDFEIKVICWDCNLELEKDEIENDCCYNCGALEQDKIINLKDNSKYELLESKGEK